GENLLPLVLASDVARALALTIDAEDIDGRAYNLSAEPCVSAREYVAEAAEALGCEIECEPSSAAAHFLGDLVKWGAKVLARHPDMRRVPTLHDWKCREQRASFDTRAAREDLGWEPVDDRDQIIER